MRINALGAQHVAAVVAVMPVSVGSDGSITSRDNIVAAQRQLERLRARGIDPLAAPASP